MILLAIFKNENYLSFMTSPYKRKLKLILLINLANNSMNSKQNNYTKLEHAFTDTDIRWPII